MRPAGGSTDPDVHYLLANRRAHEMVLESETSTAASRRVAEESIKDIDAQLSKLGYGTAGEERIEQATANPGEKRSAPRD